MASAVDTPQGSAGRPERLRHVVFLAAAAAMGGFLFGYDSAVINGVVVAVRDRFDAGSEMLAQVVAAALIGCAVGAGVAGRLADRLGRVRVMQVAAVLFIVSTFGCALSFELWQLAVWRILSGVAIGVASVVGPMYIAEVSPPAYRGRLASFQQAAIVTGIAVSQLANWGILALAGGEQRGDLAGFEAWRWMLGVMVVPAVVYGVLSLVIPESPRHLIAAGRSGQARTVLREIEGPAVDLDSKITEIAHDVQRKSKASFRDLFGGRVLFLPIVWVGIGLSVFQQLVGINVIFYYSSSLWQSIGIDPESSFFYSFETSLVNIVGTALAMTLVDRIGRKPLLLIGSCGMTVALCTTAWAFSHTTGSGDNVSLPHFQGIVALYAANLFVLFFSLSWGVAVWVLLGEIFPGRIRAAALGVAAAAQWAANWAITVTFPNLADWSLSGAYVLYAFFAALSIPFIVRFVQETRGRTLEDIGSSAL